MRNRSWAAWLSIGVALPLVVFLLLPAAVQAAEESQGVNLRWRWVYAPCNFQVNERVDELIALMERARKAGYTGLVVTDYKWGRFADRPKHYYANLDRARKAAERVGIELIPCVMPVGYSGSILMNNPNLAAALPVRDCVFEVRSGKAVIADAENLLPFGDFEQAKGNQPAGWDWVDGPGKSVFRDGEVRHGGAAAMRMETFRKGNEHGNCRLFKKLTLKPWHQYHLSLWMRTRGVSNPGDIRAAVLSPDGRSLNYTGLRAKATQGWTEHHVVFNPLEHTEVRLYVGIWGGREGTIWIDDVRLHPVAGINLLRRDGCPVKVADDEGLAFAEGRDFETWEYPKMGRDPWPGAYKVIHPEPPIVLKAGSRIRDGQRLRVSYYHTQIVYDDQVCCCLSHPELFRHLEQQVRDVKKFLAPRKYFMSHDEIRIAGWCKLCRAADTPSNPYRTAGQVLAENVRRCTGIIRKVDPRAEVFVWSDMFDPHHNARDNYYLVASTLEGSWEGLAKDIRIGNWNAGHRDASLGFFAERGHKQIVAAYYDSGTWKVELARWLDAARKAGGVEGVIYTTWRGDYSQLEAFAAALPRK